jgi:transcriptional regulator with XRE-family HTH domain
MEKAGYSGVGLAAKLDTSKSTVQQWTSGKNYPGGEYLVQLPKLLNISGHYLLCGEPPIEPPGERPDLRTAFEAGWTAAMNLVRQAVTEEPTPLSASDVVEKAGKAKAVVARATKGKQAG